MADALAHVLERRSQLGHRVQIGEQPSPDVEQSDVVLRDRRVGALARVLASRGGERQQLRVGPFDLPLSTNRTTWSVRDCTKPTPLASPISPS